MTVPALLEYIDAFSKWSGYRVNCSKYEALPITAFFECVVGSSLLLVAVGIKKTSGPPTSESSNESIAA